MKKRKAKEDHVWQVAHLIVYDSKIEIGCGGLRGGEPKKEAYPVLRELIEQINALKIAGKDYDNLCELGDDPGTYFYILNLKGYSTDAAELFIQMLLKDGWELGEVIDYRENEPTTSRVSHMAKMWIRAYIHRY